MLFDPDNPRNTLLQIEVIFNIGSTIYIYIISFRLNILVLIFLFLKISWQDFNHLFLSLFEEREI